MFGRLLNIKKTVEIFNTKLKTFKVGSDVSSHGVFFSPCNLDNMTWIKKCFEAMPIKWINQSRRTGRGPPAA